jgi:hypothetical protein
MLSTIFKPAMVVIISLGVYFCGHAACNFAKLQSIQAGNQAPATIATESELDFPVFHSERRPVFGIISAARAALDSSFSKRTFKYTYDLNNQTYAGTQEAFPVPLWADVQPDLSKQGGWAITRKDNPSVSICPAILWWQINKQMLAGFIFVVFPSAILWMSKRMEPGSADVDPVDQAYQKMRGGSRRV